MAHVDHDHTQPTATQPPVSARTHRAKIEWRKVYLPIVFSLGFSILYTFFRYTIFKGVPLSNYPSYVFNKAIAIASVIMMCASYIIGPAAKLNPSRYRKFLSWRKYLGVNGVAFLVAHAFLSITMLTPKYHPGLFQENGTFLGTMEFSLTLAAIATVHMLFLGVVSIPSVIRDMDAKQWLQIQRSGVFGLVLVAGHLGFMGYKNWINLEKYYGGMIPSTMLAALFITGTIVYRQYASRKIGALKAQETAEHRHTADLSAQVAAEVARVIQETDTHTQVKS